MGKGKKKGGKGKEEEPEVPSMSSLSLGESAPSTSQIGTEEEGGLTSAAARRKAKKAAKAAPLEIGLQPIRPSAIGDSASVPVPEPTAAPVEKAPEPKSEEKPDDDDGLGLGLAGGKKRPRKKKGAATPTASAATPAASAATPADTAATSAATPQAATSVPQPVRPTGPPPQWGAGAGSQPTGPPQFSQPAGPPRFSHPAGPPQFSHLAGPPQFSQPAGPPQFSHPTGPPQFSQPAGPPQFSHPAGPPQISQPAGPPQFSQPAGPPQFSQPAGPTRFSQPGGPPQFSQPAGPPRFSQPAGPPRFSQPAGPPRFSQPAGPSQFSQPVGPPQFSQPAGPPAAYSQPQQPSPRPAQSCPPPEPKRAMSEQGDSRPVSGSKCRYQIPKRIEGFSVPSKQIQVLTNYLQMKIKPMKIHRYDVSFKPDKPKKMISPVFVLVKNKCFPRELIAFDQMKNCYSLNQLPKVSLTDRFATEVEYTDGNGRKLTFEVSFKFTGIVDLNTILTYMKTGATSLNPPTEAIQCIDVILRQRTLGAYIKAGRQFFKRPRNPIDLGDGLEMWTGLFQSAIFTTQPFINVDVAHKGFPRQQLLVDALVKDFRLNTGSPIEQQRGRGVESFIAFIKGLRVVASIGGDMSKGGQKREFIVNGLSEPPSRLTFKMDIGNGKTKTISVADYFAQEKKCRLRYPYLNCVWVGPRDKNINYPMELLEVAYGHARNRQLNEMQLSTMVRQAATPPDERKRKIEEVIKDMDYSRNNDLKQFGLEISDKFFPVNAKVLMPPMLETGSGPIQPRNGVWQANRLLKAETLQRWGFIVIEPDTRYNDIDYAGIISMVGSCGRSMGMSVSEPVVKQFNVSMRELKNLLFQCLSDGVKFLFIIVPTRGRDYYHKVKQLAEREVGILTQCIKEQTASKRMNPQTVKNILLKVNSKLMGINQALDNRSMPNCLKDGRVMVVGADVTHPSPDQTSVPSIAAVTASLDPKCFIYNIALSIQTPKKEMIVEFEDMMLEHLRLYKERNGALPTKIFVFRDGVSEGQFAQVMNSELLAVHQAYQTLAGPTAKPEVLFLLVQKRHHTRLFLGEHNPRNVEPGTVVDKHIVHATELDFYLVSHQAIKGTARPTRYHAVCNDGGIKHDEVEQLTYYLCHLYSRCMRSVSYPTPTYYAHLACLRARSLTYEEKFDNNRLEKEPKRLRVLDKMLQYSRMFFV